MKNKKKSRPGDCSTRTAVENGTECKTAHDSTQNNTTFRGGGQIQISDFLSLGQENAVPLRYLVQLTGLPGRDLRRQIEAARRAGKPIVSNDHGYFLAENPQEIARFVKSMRRRARQIQEVAAAVEGAEIS